MTSPPKLADGKLEHGATVLMVDNTRARLLGPSARPTDSIRASVSAASGGSSS